MSAAVPPTSSSVASSAAAIASGEISGEIARAAMPADDLTQEIDRSATLLDGEVPSPQSPPPGCVFVTRCPMADQACNRSVPTLRRVSHGGHAACHFVGLATPA